MKAVTAMWSAALSCGLLAGLITWTVLDIVDPQASSLVLPVAVGVGLAIASMIVAAGRRRQVFRDLDALSGSPAPQRF
jgi:hypothetical protein